MSGTLASKGWRYARPGPIGQVLKLEQFSASLAPSAVAVKMNVAPLHRADAAVVNGTALGRSKAGASAAPFPRVGGSEGVGTVVAAPAGAAVKPGDLVWVAPVQGTWAETVVADASLVHKIAPANRDLAVFASNFILAQHLLSFGRVGASDCILQAGGSSLTALAVAAFAKQKGLTVFSAATPGARFAAAKARLAAVGSPLVEYNGKGARELRGLIGSRQPALVLDGVGGRGFNDLLKLAAPGATAVVYGAQAGPGLMFATGAHAQRETTLTGVFLPKLLRALSYAERQAKLDEALAAAATAKLQYPTETAASLDRLPDVWDELFVAGGKKGVVTISK